MTKLFESLITNRPLLMAHLVLLALVLLVIPIVLEMFTIEYNGIEWVWRRHWWYPYLQILCAIFVWFYIHASANITLRLKYGDTEEKIESPY